MKPSIYQQNIYDFISSNSGSAVVEAVAGSGKTTTVLKCLELIPKEQSVLLLAFNKSIADELKSRAPKHVDVKTFNGLGHNILGSRLGRMELDSNKMRKIVRETMDGFDYKDFGEMVYNLTGYVRRMGLLPKDMRGNAIMEDNLDSWNWLIDHFGIPCDSFIRPLIIEYARNCVIESVEMTAEEKIIDFDDQIYIPAIKNMRGDEYDWVFVDEAQDVSPVRTKLIQLVLKDSGRVIAVGDSRQAVYGFTGSDSKAMQTLRDTFNAISLPLSISYRCSKSIVNEAKSVMPTIEASEVAPLGNVNHLDVVNLECFNGGDMIICRRNAPIIALAFKLISKGIPARVMGRDISGGLIKLIEKLQPKGIDGNHGLIEKLSRWQEKEIAKWKKEDREDMIEATTDKVNCIMAIVDRTTVKSVPDLIRSIESLFSDDVNNTRAVTLCSIHKSKGLESDTVYFLDRDIIPLKSAKQDWQIEQEYNLLYVGITRAKSVLNYISSDSVR